MFDKMLSFIAPHLCFECGKTGEILCGRCIQNIVSGDIRTCIVCALSTHDTICQKCSSTVPYTKLWVAGRRHGSLKATINAFKFERAKSAYKTLAQLLDLSLPDLPKDTIIIPVPTIPSHIRQRGYDHCALMAHEFARRRRLQYAPLLKRSASSRQLGASKQKRQQQASHSFVAKQHVAQAPPYIIIDDVITTGATLQFAAQALKDGGAVSIWAAAVAYQALDD